MIFFILTKYKLPEDLTFIFDIYIFQMPEDIIFIFDIYILQMPEEQAFGVLVKIMFDYNLRELFKDGFEALHLRFYQLERLIEVKKTFYKLLLKYINLF